MARVRVFANVTRNVLTVWAPNTCVSPKAAICARRFRYGRYAVWIVRMLCVSDNFGGRRSNVSIYRPKIVWLALNR